MVPETRRPRNMSVLLETLLRGVVSTEALADLNNPANIKIMDYNKKIRDQQLKEVTSTFVRAPSSTSFHPNGLFSEEIFGEIASPNRLTTFGYIDLKCKVFHPGIFRNLLTLKAVYADIISGKAYAKFNKEIGDFEIVDMNEDGANTGYSFFLEYFDKIEFNTSPSLYRKDKLAIMEKYKDLLFVDKWLVIPAGIRDIREEDGIRKTDDINSLYSSLINYAKALPPGGNPSALFDGVRYSIQKKLVDIDEYITNILSGKTGFLQGKYGRRNLALGTRNVISPAKMAATSTDSVQFIKANETMIPLFQAAKGFQPLVVFQLKNLFFNRVLSPASDQISLIDTKTYALDYHPISEEEKDKFMSSDGLKAMINLYRDTEFRSLPVTARDEDGKPYYMFLVYDDGDVVYHYRNTSEFQEWYEKNGHKFHPDQQRPLTYIEMLYVATYAATIDKHVTITRYPVLEVGSTYPSKVHLASTDKSRVVICKQPFAEVDIQLPHYPIVGRRSIDSTQLHPSRLKGLGADFDGDTVSVNSILSKEANEECAEYLNTIRNTIGANGRLAYGWSTDLVTLTFFNLSKRGSSIYLSNSVSVPSKSV